MPVEPAEPLLLSEPVVALPDPVVELGESVVPPAEDEPEVPCCCRQRSFSEPVRLSHCVLEPTLGAVLEDAPPLALGELVELEPVVPLVELDEESLPVALGLEPTLPDDEDCAKAAAENANSVAIVAVPITFNIGLLS